MKIKLTDVIETIYWGNVPKIKQKKQEATLWGQPVRCKCGEKTTVVHLLTLSVVMENSINVPTPTSFLAPMCRMYLVLGRKFSSFISWSAFKIKRLNRLSSATDAATTAASLTYLFTLKMFNWRSSKTFKLVQLLKRCCNFSYSSDAATMNYYSYSSFLL